MANDRELLQLVRDFNAAKAELGTANETLVTYQKQIQAAGQCWQWTSHVELQPGNQLYHRNTGTTLNWPSSSEVVQALKYIQRLTNLVEKLRADLARHGMPVE